MSQAKFVLPFDNGDAITSLLAFWKLCMDLADAGELSWREDHKNGELIVVDGVYTLQLNLLIKNGKPFGNGSCGIKFQWLHKIFKQLRLDYTGRVTFTDENIVVTAFKEESDVEYTIKAMDLNISCYSPDKDSYENNAHFTLPTTTFSEQVENLLFFEGNIELEYEESADGESGFLTLNTIDGLFGTGKESFPVNPAEAPPGTKEKSKSVKTTFGMRMLSVISKQFSHMALNMLIMVGTSRPIWFTVVLRRIGTLRLILAPKGIEGDQKE